MIPTSLLACYRPPLMNHKLKTVLQSLAMLVPLSYLFLFWLDYLPSGKSTAPDWPWWLRATNIWVMTGFIAILVFNIRRLILLLPDEL